MKKLFVLLFTIACFTSCSDPCEDVVCQNDGTCDDGICICVEGYMGTNCETEIRAAFLGNWITEYTCDNQLIDEVIASISADPNNILGIVFDIDDGIFNGIVDANGNITVSDQEVFVNGMSVETSISGTGDMANDIINLNFMITDSGVPSSCTFTLTR